MSNSYEFIDSDFTYTDPNTGLLRNLQGITDPDVLIFVESGVVIKRLQELYENPIKIKGVDSLFEIHFKTYTVGLGKSGKLKLVKKVNSFFLPLLLIMLQDLLTS